MISIREELTQEKKKQREKIREFEQLQLSYQAYGLPPQLAGWLGYLYCVILAAFFPAQTFVEYDNGMSDVIYMMYLWVTFGTQLHLMPYMQFKEQKKNVSVLQKIKYLPVDLVEVKIVWMGYLLNYIKKIFLLALIAQFSISLLLYHEITRWNLLHVVIIAASPLLINGLTILCAHYPRK